MRNLLLLASLLVVSVSCPAADSAADKIAAGRAALVAHDLVAAKARFAEALTLDPANSTAAAYLGITRYFAIVHLAGSQTLLDRAGVTPEGRDLYNLTARFVRDGEGLPQPVAGCDLDEVFACWRDTITPESELARAELALVADPAFTLTLPSTETTLPDPVTIDYGDLLVLRAGLRAAEFLAHFWRGQNTHADVNALLDLAQGDLLTLPRVLQDNPQLFAAGSPAERLQARAVLVEAFELYRQASTFIRARPAGVDRLFMLEADDLAGEAEAREQLVRIERSLDGFVDYTPTERDSHELINLAPVFGGTHSLRSLVPATQAFDPFGGVDLSLGGILSGLTLEHFTEIVVGAGYKADLGWSWVTPTPDGNTMSGAAYGNGRYLQAGGYGIVRTSADGTTWTSQQVANVGLVRGLTFNNGKFTLLADNGVFRSADGVGWRYTGYLGSGTQLIPVGTRAAAYDLYGLSLISEDGENMGSGIQVNDPVAGVGLRYIFSLIFGGGLYVAGGMDGAFYYGRIFTSPDGCTWTLRKSATGYTADTAIPYSASAFGAGRFVVVGSQNLLLTSTDGITWNRGTVLPSGTAAWSSVAFDGNRFVASEAGGLVATSPDGLVWTQAAAPAVSGRVAGANGRAWVQGSAGAMLYSAGGALVGGVSAATSGIPQAATLRQIRTLGGRLFAIGDGGGVYVSSDGTNFTPATTGVADILWDIAEHGGTYVAVGNAGRCLTSSDGLVWTSRTSGVSDTLRTVAYLNDRFVAAGNSGRIIVSPDGVTWTSVANFGTGYSFSALAYGAGSYMAVGIYSGTGGTYGPVVTSTNGTLWQSAPGHWDPLSSVAFSGGRFWVATSSGKVLASDLPLAWSKEATTLAEASGNLQRLDARWSLMQDAGTSARGQLNLAVGIGYEGWIPAELPAPFASNNLTMFAGSYYYAASGGAILRTRRMPAPGNPVLFADPAGASAAAGDTVGLAAGVYGEGKMAYQWYKDGVPLAGATTPELLFDAQPSHAGTYRVTVSNAAGTMTSGAAVVTVDSPFADWRRAGFTTGELANPAISGPLAVLGPDTAPNLLKYALGVAPRSPVPGGALVFVPPAVPGTGAEWVLTFQRPADRTDVVYAVEASSDLVQWSGSGVVLERLAPAGGDGMETWQGRVVSDHAKLFLRLHATLR